MDSRERYLLRYIDDYCDLILDDNIEIVRDLLMCQLISPYFYDLEDECITPIATAAYYGSVNCLELLCEYGAMDCLPCNKRKMFLDPLIAAIMGNQIEAVWILLEAGSGRNLLWKGLWDCLPDIMTYLALRK